MRVAPTKNIEEIRPLMESWAKESDADSFGIETDVDYAVAEMTKWIEQSESDVLVADDGEPVGFLALFVTSSILAGQRVAAEKYWYVRSDHRRCGMLLLARAKDWAREHNCTHLLMTASRLAGSMFDKVSRFYVKQGFEHIESSFIKEV